MNDAILRVPTFVPNFTNVENPECQQHGKIFLRQLRGYKLWALQSESIDRNNCSFYFHSKAEVIVMTSTRRCSIFKLIIVSEKEFIWILLDYQSSLIEPFGLLYIDNNPNVSDLEKFHRRSVKDLSRFKDLSCFQC